MAEIIYILTGPVRSGKTTMIAKWTLGKSDVLGILTPVINGKRMFMNVHSRERFEMEANSGETEILIIGKFKFSKAGFLKAVDILRNGLNEKTGWLIIDEIGPLELGGEAFSGVLKEILQSSSNQQKILLIVRDSILEEVVQFFGLRQYKFVIIDTESDLFKK